MCSTRSAAANGRTSPGSWLPTDFVARANLLMARLAELDRMQPGEFARYERLIADHHQRARNRHGPVAVPLPLGPVLVGPPPPSSPPPQTERDHLLPAKFISGSFVMRTLLSVVLSLACG